MGVLKNTFAFIGTARIRISSLKRESKMLFRKKIKFEDIVKNTNYEIINAFKYCNVKFYDMQVIELNISIIGAFWSVYKNNDDVLKFALNYKNSLSHSKLSKEELDEILTNIINNKIYIEMELIKKLDTEKLFSELTRIIIEDCTDSTYTKFSQLSVMIMTIIINNVNLIK